MGNTTMMSALRSTTAVFLLLTLALVARCREDVAAPVRPGEKSTRDWEKAAAQQEDDEQERAKIREMGGKDTALVNILEGQVEDGKIHPVGDRTKGVAMVNMTEVASEFLATIGL